MAVVVDLLSGNTVSRRKKFVLCNLKQLPSSQEQPSQKGSVPSGILEDLHVVVVLEIVWVLAINVEILHLSVKSGFWFRNGAGPSILQAATWDCDAHPRTLSGEPGGCQAPKHNSTKQGASHRTTPRASGLGLGGGGGGDEVG